MRCALFLSLPTGVPWWYKGPITLHCSGFDSRHLHMRMIGRFLLPWERSKREAKRVHVSYRNGSRVRRKSTRKRKRKEKRQWQSEIQSSE